MLSPQADVSWSVNGVPKGTIKQSLGQVPIMVKSKMCNLYGLSPKELIEHHEEAEVQSHISDRSKTTCNVGSHLIICFKSTGNGRLFYRERNRESDSSADHAEEKLSHYLV